MSEFDPATRQQRHQEIKAGWKQNWIISDDYDMEGSVHDICHSIAVIGLHQHHGSTILEELLNFDVPTNQIVAVDAFDTFGAAAANDSAFRVKFPTDSHQMGGIMLTSDVHASRTNPYTDDLAYNPVAACDIAVIACPFDKDDSRSGLLVAETTVSLLRLGLQHIIIVYPGYNIQKIRKTLVDLVLSK